MFISIINGHHRAAIKFIWFKEVRKPMANNKVTIKCLDIILRFVESIPVENFGDFMIKNGSSSIDMKFDKEGMEIAGDDYDFSPPIAEGGVIVFLVNGNCSVEGHIGERNMNPGHFLHHVNELHLQNLNRFSSTSPLEVHHKETMSQFSDNQTIGTADVGE